MAYIILPSRRTRQPQGAVQVDWSRSLARGLMYAIETNGTLFDPVRRRFAVNGGGFSYVARSDGQYANLVGSQYVGLPFGDFEFPTSGDWTYASSGINSTSQFHAFSAWNDSGSGRYLYFAVDGGTLYLDIPWVQAITSTPAPSAGVLHRYLCTKNGSTVSIYVDGLHRASATITGTQEAPTNGARVGANTGAVAWTIGTVGVIRGWRRGFSAAEVMAEYANPWQLFAPDQRRIYFGTGAATGGSIFESTFANTLSLADTYAALANYVSTYADSPTVTDSSSTSVIYTSAFNETIPVSDGPSADMGGVANRTQEESFTITDAYSASMVATATISETLSAEASLAASAIFNVTFAETLPIVDGEEADAGRISDIAENVSVTDAYTAGIVAQATQAESVTTIDTYDTIAIYNPLLAETLPITDAVGATLTVPTSGTVDLSQESIDSLAHEIMVQLTSTPVRKL